MINKHKLFYKIKLKTKLLSNYALNFRGYFAHQHELVKMNNSMFAPTTLNIGGVEFVVLTNSFYQNSNFPSLQCFQ